MRCTQVDRAVRAPSGVGGREQVAHGGRFAACGQLVRDEAGEQRHRGGDARSANASASRREVIANDGAHLVELAQRRRRPCGRQQHEPAHAHRAAGGVRDRKRAPPSELPTSTAGSRTSSSSAATVARTAARTSAARSVVAASRGRKVDARRRAHVATQRDDHRRERRGDAEMPWRNTSVRQRAGARRVVEVHAADRRRDHRSRSRLAQQLSREPALEQRDQDRCMADSPTATPQGVRRSLRARRGPARTPARRRRSARARAGGDRARSSGTASTAAPVPWRGNLSTRALHVARREVEQRLLARRRGSRARHARCVAVARPCAASSRHT